MFERSQKVVMHDELSTWPCPSRPGVSVVSTSEVQQDRGLQHVISRVSSGEMMFTVRAASSELSHCYYSAEDLPIVADRCLFLRGSSGIMDAT